MVTEEPPPPALPPQRVDPGLAVHQRSSFVELVVSWTASCGLMWGYMWLQFHCYHLTTGWPSGKLAMLGPWLVQECVLCIFVVSLVLPAPLVVTFLPRGLTPIFLRC